VPAPSGLAERVLGLGQAACEPERADNRRLFVRIRECRAETEVLSMPRMREAPTGEGETANRDRIVTSVLVGESRADTRGDCRRLA